MEVYKVHQTEPEQPNNSLENINDLHNKFDKENGYFFGKCKVFCDLNISPDQLGAPLKFSLDFLPAITEFANLDNYNTPIKKLNCLCTTLDLIYADLKYFLIELFCISSDAELQIPIVEERDVSAILLYVIIKAKPLHLTSNIYLMENFVCYSSSEYDEKKEILKKFKVAVEKLFHLSETFLRPANEGGLKDLDLKKIIALTNDKINYKEISTPLQLRNYEILKLILLATNI